MNTGPHRPTRPVCCGPLPHCSDQPTT
jgi:hypothetical protein